MNWEMVATERFALSRVIPGKLSTCCVYVSPRLDENWGHGPDLRRRPSPYEGDVLQAKLPCHGGGGGLGTRNPRFKRPELLTHLSYTSEKETLQPLRFIFIRAAASIARMAPAEGLTPPRQRFKGARAALHQTGMVGSGGFAPPISPPRTERVNSYATTREIGARGWCCANGLLHVAQALCC